MRALLLTQHFPPEITAASFRLGPIAEALATRGHEVEVICPVPNHPSGTVEQPFAGRLLVRRSRDGLRIRYVWIYARPEKTLRTRAAAYGSYALAATILGTVRGRVDLVLASSPPLSVGAAGLAAALRHRCPFAFDVRDLWPDSAVDLGELPPGGAAAAMSWLERRLYGHADLVLTPNDAFADVIRSRSSGTPVEVVPNGTTPDWLAAGKAEVARGEVGFPEDTFVLAYAGNVGLAHALEEAIEASGLLDDDFRLVIIGAGPRRGSLEKRAGRLPPGRVEFRDLMSSADAARHLRAADAVLVAERQTRTVSAKLYDCCAIGRPLIAVCGGELDRVVRNAGVGVPVPLGDPPALAAAVAKLRSEPDLRDRLVERARAYAAEHLRDGQAEQLAERLERITSTS